ncbi:MAG: hypothetical protein FWD61_19310 [Phycisphaerales bacterium]|nr:hypothetical protein [Phycisphaerales bacterium]
MTNVPENNGSEKSGRGSYPYYSFAKSLEIADAIRDLGGNKQPVKRNTLSSHLGQEEKSAGLSQMIGAAKCFGLIDGRSEYTLTDISREYYYPTDDNQKRRAMLLLIANPATFKKLIERFDGAKLPTIEMLANLMHREMDVPQSWMARIASMFVNCLKESGVIDGTGILRYAVALNGIATGTGGDGDDPPPPPPPSPPNNHQTGVSNASGQMGRGNDVNVWVFGPPGASVRVETSHTLTMDVWKKLEKYIQVLKPMEES